MKTSGILLFGALLLAACGSTNRNPDQHAATAGSSAGGAGAVGSGGDGAGGDDAEACSSSPGLSVPAGLVRLTFGELNAALTQLFGAEGAKAIGAELELDASDIFPPLASPREGTVITSTNFTTGDKMAQNAGAYVREHFEAVTLCTADDYACVNDFVTTLAQRAFRRALTGEEQSALERVVSGAQALGAPAEQGAEYGVYAVLESPHFLYRTEFGPPAAAEAGEVRLSDDELASSLAFFLTGAPPDQALLDAAAAHDLGGPEQLAPHVGRLLQSPAGRQHLERTLGNYFGLSRLQTIVIDAEVYPEFTASVRQSMDHELRQFFRDTLWQQPVSSLLTSRSARVDATLAAIYGIELPGSGLDADGFVQVELPENRAGLLTRAGMLTSRTRPDGPSVVGRGLGVFSEFTCAEAPAFPNLVNAMLDDPNRPGPGASERELAGYRMTTEPCKGCHVEFDPYGLALDEFDGVGRHRSMDPEGRPIDAVVQLPAAAGGVMVQGGVGLSEALAGEIFETCLTQRFLYYALASAAPDSKSVRCEAASLGDLEMPTFTDLLSSVALSRAFATRTR